LTIEVSVVVDRKDVERTYRRADLLRRVGYKVIPVVAGEEATLGAEAEARSQSVVMLQDGRSLLWDEAFAKWAV
jgi:predicted CoA-binding protein